LDGVCKTCLTGIVLSFERLNNISDTKETMKASDLSDLIGRECVLLEGGRGMIVRCLRFYDEGDHLKNAEFDVSHPSVFAMNRIAMNGEPAIA
jgi:hypothetical protein